MDIQIHNLASKKWKTILIKQGIAFLSTQTYTSIERMEVEIKNPAYANDFEAFPLSNVTELKFNDDSDEVEINYINKEDRVKDITLKIGHENLAQDFGNNLGAELGLTKNTSVEKKWKIILKNSVYIILFVVLPMIAYGKAGNLKDVVWLFAGVIGVGFLYSMINIIKKLRKPTNYTVYTKTNETLSLEEQPLKLKLPLLEEK